MAVLAALRGDLVAERAARRTAEIGLQAKMLEAERLRVLIARLRHERFGRFAERLAGEVEQLELRLDEVLADIAAVHGAEEAAAATSTEAPEEVYPAPWRLPDARQPAAARRGASACPGLHLPVLWRRPAQGRRGRDGDP